MRDWMLRMLAVISAGVVLLAPALPAAADVARPTWYGGAVKAFDRMGVGKTDLPWWMSDGTAQQIVRLDKSRTIKIDANLADRLNGVPSQADYDKALADHAGKMAYKDKTVDLALWLDSLGETFADGYAGSVNGSLVYGQTGYVPDKEEIEAESLKLAHTSSYLLAQARDFDPDAAAAVSPSCAIAMGRVMAAVDRSWTTGADTPGTMMAASVSRDPEFGDVVTYDPKDFKKFDAMTMLDRDGGALYYDQIEKELKKKSKGSGIDVGKVGTKKVTGRQAAKQIFAGIVRKGKGLLKGATLQAGLDFAGHLGQSTLGNLIDLTYGSQAWCDSYAWGIGQKNMAIGVLSVLGKAATKTFAGLDCDNLEQRKKFLDDVQWVKAMKELQGKQQDDHETSYGSWKWHWSPWYVATASDGMTCYLRVKVYENADGLSFIDVAGGEVSAPTMTNALVRPDYDSFTQQSSMHPELIGPVLPRQADAKGQVWDGTSFMTVNSDSAIGRQCGLSRKGYDCAYKYTSQLSYASDVEYRPYQFAWVNSSTFRNFTSFASIVPGSLDWVMAHMHFHWGNNDRKEYDWSLKTMERTLTDSSWSGSTIARESYRFTACGGDCPAAYQPTGHDQDVSVDVTSQPGDGQTHTASAGGQSTGDATGWAPGHISTKVNQDGTVSGSVSIDAKTPTGTVNLGSGDLTGTYVNPQNKRLDLIDVKTGKSCFAEGYACVDWIRETQEILPKHQLDVTTKATTKDTPLTYKCSYAEPGKVVEVPIGECVVYGPAFKESNQRSGQTTGQPDGSTSTQTGTKPDFKYDWDDCVKSATSDTAAAWLYSPVTCAAHQLFIPDDKVMTTTASRFQRDTWQGILPQFRTLQANWGALFEDFSDHGCHGVFISFGWGDLDIYRDQEVLNACPGSDLEYLPTLSKAAITIALALMAFSICRKAVMAIFDFHVSGGGDQ